MTDVFISYSRRDVDFVRRLDEELKRTGRKTWVDWGDIPPTAEWEKEIQTGIERANTVLFVISPDSIASSTCQQELALATKNNKKVVPVLLRQVGPLDLPAPLAAIQWIGFDNRDFEGNLLKLIAALDMDLDWWRAHTRLLASARNRVGR